MQHPTLLSNPIGKRARDLATPIEVVTREEQQIDADTKPSQGSLQAEIFGRLVRQVRLDDGKIEV
jgi:hypothetical protein